MPIDLGSVGGGITDVAYSRVKEYLGIKGDEGTTYTTTLTVSQFDERVLRALDVDVRRVGLRGSKRRPGRVEQPDGSWADEWGIFYRKAGYYNQIVKNPLRNATVADLARHPWPDAGDPSLVEGLAAQARNLHDGTDLALSAKSVSGGIFQTCSRLRSMEQFLMDMLLDKPFARELLARVEEAVLNLTEALLSAVGPYVQMVETQDDLGTQRAPLISPALYREMIQPCHARLSALIKKKTDGKAKVFLHSDGSIFDVIPDVIDAGIEVLNPLQPHAAKMDPKGLESRLRQAAGVPRRAGPAEDHSLRHSRRGRRRCPPGHRGPGTRRRLHLRSLPQPAARRTPAEHRGHLPRGERVWGVSDKVKGYRG